MFDAFVGHQFAMGSHLVRWSGSFWELRTEERRLRQFSKKQTWGFKSLSHLFQNFHFEVTCRFRTSNEDEWPSFRSIRSIWQEILNFKISNFTCNFFTKVSYRGFKSRGRPFSNLLHCGSLSIPNTTGESPTRMGGTVLDLGASGHWLDYVIDNIILCLGLLRHILGAL